MKEVPKKLFSVIMAGVLTLSSVSLASAAEPNGMPQDESIPEGYKVIKQYDTNDESTKISSPVELNTMTELENNQSSLSTNSIEKENVSQNTYNKVTNEETHLYRELQDVNTGNTMNQYVTDLSVSAPGSYERKGTEKDSVSGLSLTIRLFYHTKTKADGNTYLGLDKIYYRYDKPNTKGPLLSVNGRVNQSGPGLDGKAKLQTMTLPSQYLTYKVGTTKLVNLQNTGWTEVLDGGLATQLGIQLTARFIGDNGQNQSFQWQLFINGQGVF
ncbi:hypothetical protein PO903_08935 [Paenibacillus sp. PK4536]|uniref:hypothetical protein n=1 Tax=Paenibacillus sp. PK4536 TaxID=3024576 RepID=UPI002358B18C|nr:hypothetical protein [Paenibacillus sp. PK4536]WIM40971.1 hypothetical protein PO903_08935 [Paenibacillus sp. PK4536]